MLAVREAVGTRHRRSVWAYRKKVLNLPKTQVFMVLFPALFAAVFGAPLTSALFFLVGEAALLAVLPMSARFRKKVDDEADEAEAQKASEAREALAARMSAEHQKEWEVLGRLAAKVHAKLGEDSSGEDALQFGPLFVTFLRLAVAHKESCDLFKPSMVEELREHEGRLKALAASSSPDVRTWIEVRTAMSEQRREVYERAIRDRIVVAHGIGLIGEYVRWAHEQVVADSLSITRDGMEDLLEAWRVKLEALEEMAAMFDQPPPVAAPVKEPYGLDMMV